MNPRFFNATLLLLASFVSFAMALEPDSFQKQMVGYLDKGDSVEFVFGDQKVIHVGKMEISLDKRRDEIKYVTLAGDFNEWSPDNAMYRLKKVDAKLYKLVLSKKSIGKKGELRQFKFVLNGKYWIEPPPEATNKYTGSDGYTNLTIRL